MKAAVENEWLSCNLQTWNSHHFKWSLRLFFFQILMLDETHRTFFMESGKQMIAGLMVKANKVKRSSGSSAINLSYCHMFEQLYIILNFFIYLLQLRAPNLFWKAMKTCWFTLGERKRGSSLKWSWRAEGWVAALWKILYNQQTRVHVNTGTLISGTLLSPAVDQWYSIKVSAGRVHTCSCVLTSDTDTTRSLHLKLAPQLS